MACIFFTLNYYIKPVAFEILMEIKMLHSDLGHLNFVIFKAIVGIFSFVLRKLPWLVIIAE